MGTWKEGYLEVFVAWSPVPPEPSRATVVRNMWEVQS